MLFVRMWAVAHVVHIGGATDSRIDTPWNGLVVVAALVLIRFPERGAWLAVLAAAQLVDTVVEMPFSPDHWVLVAGVNLALLLTMAARRSWDEGVVAAVLPAARVLVLVAYGAAALSKYNTTFLEPLTSCATAIANVVSFGLADRIGLPPMWATGALAVETAIPLLLLVPATRRHGVRLGMAFHFLLSASPSFAVVDFTAVLFALFMLFLSEEEVGDLTRKLAALSRRSAVVTHARRFPRVAAMVALALFGVSGYVEDRSAAAVLYVASEIYLLTFLVLALLTWRKPRTPRALGRPLWIQAPAIVLLVVWASSPYLGFRTASVFTMFSSLRTEGAAPNHLFLPTARLADWQDDFVVIETSNHPDHAAAQGGVVGVPLLGLRRIATDFPELVVTGRRDGEPVTYGPNPGQVPLAPLDGWRYKFLLFRPAAVSEERFCGVT